MPGDAAAGARVQRRRERLLSLGGDSDLTWRSRGGTAMSVPGFSSAPAELPACRDPQQAFQLLCADSGAEQPGMTERSWLRLAPTLGMADVITARSTFRLLARRAAGEEAASAERTICMTTFAMYAARMQEKSSPGTDHVGGWMKGESADSILQSATVELADGERVLLAGGMPAYAIQDMVTKFSRTNGSLVLTTHALYWRPSWRGKQKLRRFELLPAASSASGELQWTVTDYRAGPLGLGVMDTALRLTQYGALLDEPEPESASEPDPSAAAQVFNFPLHAKHRDAFLCAVEEVVAAHAFARERLGSTAGLPPAVTEAVLGSVVRYRAASGLAPSGTRPVYSLPFSIVMAEPADSALSTSMVKLFSLPSPRAEPEPEPELLSADGGDDREAIRPPLVRAVSFTSENALHASEAVAAAVSERCKQEERLEASKATVTAAIGDSEEAADSALLPLARLARVKHNLTLSRALRKPLIGCSLLSL